MTWTACFVRLQVKHMRASYGSNVIFTLMNSFSTSADTRAFFKEKHPELLEVSWGRGRGRAVTAAASEPATAAAVVTVVTREAGTMLLPLLDAAAVCRGLHRATSLRTCPVPFRCPPACLPASLAGIERSLPTPLSYGPLPPPVKLAPQPPLNPNPGPRPAGAAD
jgi:hypothetical protein